MISDLIINVQKTFPIDISEWRNKVFEVVFNGEEFSADDHICLKKIGNWMKCFVKKNMSKSEFNSVFADILIEEMEDLVPDPMNLFKNTKIKDLLHASSTYAQQINKQVLMVIINRDRGANQKDTMFRVTSKNDAEQRIVRGVLKTIIILFLELHQIRIKNIDLIKEYVFDKGYPNIASVLKKIFDLVSKCAKLTDDSTDIKHQFTLKTS